MDNIEEIDRRIEECLFGYWHCKSWEQHYKDSNSLGAAQSYCNVKERAIDELKLLSIRLDRLIKNQSLIYA